MALAVVLAITHILFFATVQAEFDVNCNVVTSGIPPGNGEGSKTLGPFTMQPEQDDTEWILPRDACESGFHSTAWTVTACDTNLKGPTIELTQFSATIHRRPPHPGTAEYHVDVYCTPRK